MVECHYRRMSSPVEDDSSVIAEPEATVQHAPRKSAWRKVVCVLVVLVLFLIASAIAFFSLYALLTVPSTGPSRADALLATENVSSVTGRSETPSTNPTTAGQPQQPQTEDPVQEPIYRLTKDVFPVSYHFWLFPKMRGAVGVTPDEENTSSGVVEIELDVIKPVNNITLHAFELDIDVGKSSLVQDKKTIEIESIQKLHEETPQAMINLILGAQLRPGHARLKLTFRGRIYSSKKNGLLIDWYTENGRNKTVLFTRLEPLAARALVPCFDEPEFKATWTVQIVHPRNTTAASNAETTETKNYDGNNVISSFAKTPKMSSYLLAIIVSEFKSIEATTKSGVKLRVWMRPETIYGAQYALEAGVKAFDFFAQQFAVPYPFKKLDMFALVDFNGGSENWGIIAYAETILFHDVNVTPIVKRQLTFGTIAHEISHMWIGDLATMRFWDDLWLKEGFATLFQDIGSVPINDGLATLENLTPLNIFAVAIYSEVGDSTLHPVSYIAENFTQIYENYDGLVYGKGSVILAMLRQLIGSENFMQASRDLLLKYQYTNYDSLDFFNVFKPEHLPVGFVGPTGQGFDFVDFLSQYIFQMSYPILSIEWSGDEVTITQTPFQPVRDIPKPYLHPKHEFAWDVPIWYQEGSDPKVKFVWLTRQEPLTLKAVKPLVLNSGSFGYYEVDYGAENLGEVAKVLRSNFNVYSPTTRMRLLRDAFKFSASDQASEEYQKAVYEVATYISKEHDYMPWSAFYSEISLKKVFPNEAQYNELMDLPYTRLNYDDVKRDFPKLDKFFEMKLASDAITVSCSHTNACRQKVLPLFEKEVMAKCKHGDVPSKCVKVSPPYRQLVYCAGAFFGGDPAHEMLNQLHSAEVSLHEKSTIRNALLMCLPNKETPELHLKRLLGLESGLGRTSQAEESEQMHALLDNPLIRDGYIQFLSDNWDAIYKDKAAAVLATSVLHKSVRNETDLNELTLLAENRPTMRAVFKESLDLNRLFMSIY